MRELLDDETVSQGLPLTFAPWLTEVRSEIDRLEDPANVLGAIWDIEQDYHRITERFSFGKMLADAEEIVGPIDSPPLVDTRLRAAIAEIKTLIRQTLSRVGENPKS